MVCVGDSNKTSRTGWGKRHEIQEKVRNSSNKDNTFYKHYYALSLMGRINDAKWGSIILTYLYWQV